MMYIHELKISWNLHRLLRFSVAIYSCIQGSTSLPATYTQIEFWVCKCKSNSHFLFFNIFSIIDKKNSNNSKWGIVCVRTNRLWYGWAPHPLSYIAINYLNNYPHIKQKGYASYSHWLICKQQDSEGSKNR